MAKTLVLAIDPGSAKCGVALVSGTPGHEEFQTVYRAVVEREALSETITRLTSQHAPDVVVIGNGTRHEDVLEELKLATSAPIRVVDEYATTLAARKLYFEENPPSGMRRLIPRSMQTPQVPYDDYVAILLARRYLKAL